MMNEDNRKIVSLSNQEQCESTAMASCCPVGLMPSTKIRDRHWDRLAIVYVRQSSPHQVKENRESRERQYALTHFATGLGWSADRVLVIDEDQGQSGKFSEDRNGFQRLLAEVSLDHVGLVLGLELSRLSRSCKDWHHLVEVCAVFDTLLGDQDGIYDANDSNDRLLLGMKGAMSEFELITLHNRLERGRLNKAERGELFLSVPVGYLKLPSGDVIQEPDEQARAVVQLIFDKFQELGTAWSVFRYLIRNNIRLGFRGLSGANRGQLEWRRPHFRSIISILRHPIYAGAYAYGLHQPRRKHPSTGRNERGALWLPPDQIRVLLRNRLPGYITWEQYEANQQRLQQNRSLPYTQGVPRRGEALLTGLLICGSCGHALHPIYRKKDKFHYVCDSHLAQNREQTCYGWKPAELDVLVSQQVLRALEPAALELSLRAVEDMEQERERIHRLWKQQLERASYESASMERQYHAVDSENRLVARTLEKRWEESLRKRQQIQEEYDRFLREVPPCLSNEDRSRIQVLGRDIALLWHAPHTSAADRKEIIRCLVEQIVVTVQHKSEYVDITIHWQGGFLSQHEIVRPLATFKRLRDYDCLMERLEQLHREGKTMPVIAAALNAEGFVPPRQGVFTVDTVSDLMLQKGLTSERSQPGILGPHEWWVSDLARALELSPNKIYYWIHRGRVHHRRTPKRKHVIVWADSAEINRLRELNGYGASRALKDLPNLTTPCPRDIQD
jgi:DNA invertase Pin-like site-specific DNA recombinase